MRWPATAWRGHFAAMFWSDGTIRVYKDDEELPGDVAKGLKINGKRTYDVQLIHEHGKDELRLDGATIYTAIAPLPLDDPPGAFIKVVGMTAKISHLRMTSLDSAATGTRKAAGNAAATQEAE